MLGNGLCRLFDTRLGEGDCKDEFVWTPSTYEYWSRVVIGAFTFEEFEPLLAIHRGGFE